MAFNPVRKQNEYQENSAGQLAAVADGERQAPIAEFVGNIAKFAGTVNNVSKAGSETYFQSNSDSQDSQRERTSLNTNLTHTDQAITVS